MAFRSSYGPILYHFWHNARYCLKITFFYTHCHIRYWGSRWTVSIRFGMEKLEWCGYPVVKNIEDIFTRLDRVHERDRRTDRQTDTAWRHRSRLCIALRRKNDKNGQSWILIVLQTHVLTATGHESTVAELLRTSGIQYRVTGHFSIMFQSQFFVPLPSDWMWSLAPENLTLKCVVCNRRRSRTRTRTTVETSTAMNWEQLCAKSVIYTFMITGLDRIYHAHHFIFGFAF